MANINGLKGFNPSSGTSRLLAAYGNDIINVSTGTGYSLNLNGNNVEMEVFLNRVFLQNYNARPVTYETSANKWTTALLGRTPRSKFIKAFKNRLYLGYCQFSRPSIPISYLDDSEPTFPSRVFYSDLPTGWSTFSNLTWGMEWSGIGTIYRNTNFIEAHDTDLPGLKYANFVSSNIKVGDPLYITNYAPGNPSFNPSTTGYIVTSIESPYRLRLNKTFTNTSNGIQFWVGSNWFDVSPDDNDEITGMGENSDRLLIFKLLSLWFYTGSQLRKVKDAVGTSSHRSIVNHKGNTYYFHGSNPLISGIYMYDGVNSMRISRGIDPFIRGMAASAFDDVVAWKEGEELRWYLGTLTNTNYNISMSNAVATLNTVTGAWDVSPIADVVTCSTVFRTSGQEDTYVGTSDDQVLKMSSGNSFNGSAINALLDTKPYYPAGTDVINDFTKIQVIGRAVKGTKVKYKLWDTPRDVDDEWYALGELTGDKTELDIQTEHNQGSGIQLRFEDVGTLENDAFVEKFTIFYKPDRRRFL